VCRSNLEWKRSATTQLNVLDVPLSISDGQNQIAIRFNRDLYRVDDSIQSVRESTIWFNWCAIRFDEKTKDFARISIFCVNNQLFYTMFALNYWIHRACPGLCIRWTSFVHHSNRQMGLWQAVILVTRELTDGCIMWVCGCWAYRGCRACVSCIRPVIARCSPNPSALHCLYPCC
jgi:hypothetical protein